MAARLVCGGVFYGKTLGFDTNGIVHSFNPDGSVATTNVALSATNISNCLCNSLNKLFFVEYDDNTATATLYAASLSGTTFTISTNNVSGVDPNSTVLLNAPSSAAGCVLYGTATKSASQLKLFCSSGNNNSSVSSSSSNIELQNVATTANGALYQIAADGGSMNFYQLTSASGGSYTFSKESNVPFSSDISLINSTFLANTISGTTSDQVLVVNNSTGQLQRITNITTGTATVISSELNGWTPGSVLFYDSFSNLIVMNGAPSYYFYNSSAPTISSNGSPSSAGQANSSSSSAPSSTGLVSLASGSSNGKFSGAAIGTFLPVGIIIGALIAGFLTFCIMRRKERSSSGRTNNLHNRGLLSEGLPPVKESLSNYFGNNSGRTDVSSDRDEKTNFFYTNSAVVRRSPAKPRRVTTNILAEASPFSQQFSSIFGDSYRVIDMPYASINPRHRDSNIYVRKGATPENQLVLIHYFKQNNETQFERSVAAISSLGKYTENRHVVSYKDSVKLATASYEGKWFQYLLVTSYFDPTESLSRLYDNAEQKNLVAEVSSDTFIIWSVYSILLAVRDLHVSGFVHRRLSPHCFYATSDIPGTEWVLADFDDASVEGESFDFALGESLYVDPELKPGERFRYHSDIYALGCVLRYITSKADMFRTQHKEKYDELVQAALERDPARHHSANDLVELWENYFDFYN